MLKPTDGLYRAKNESVSQVFGKWILVKYDLSTKTYQYRAIDIQKKVFITSLLIISEDRLIASFDFMPSTESMSHSLNFKPLEISTVESLKNSLELLPPSYEELEILCCETSRLLIRQRIDAALETRNQGEFIRLAKIYKEITMTNGSIIISK